MNKLLKCIISGIMGAIILFQPLSIYAMTTSENTIVENERDFSLDKSKASLVNVTYHTPSGNEKAISTCGVYIPAGTMKIEDYICDEDLKKTEYPKQKFSSFETFKYSTVKFASNLPRIGKWVEKGEDLWNFIKAVSTDIKSGVPSNIIVQTEYTSRYFYHFIYRWDGGKWVDIGESLSRYYYKVVKREEYRNGKWEFYRPSVNDNIYAPNAISKAPNYNNRQRICELAEEDYSRRQRFRERY